MACIVNVFGNYGMWYYSGGSYRPLNTMGALQKYSNRSI